MERLTLGNLKSALRERKLLTQIPEQKGKEKENGKVRVKGHATRL
jgi:hypothetical protein